MTRPCVMRPEPLRWWWMGAVGAAALAFPTATAQFFADPGTPPIPNGVYQGKMGLHPYDWTQAWVPLVLEVRDGRLTGQARYDGNYADEFRPDPAYSVTYEGTCDPERGEAAGTVTGTWGKGDAAQNLTGHFTAAVDEGRVLVGGGTVNCEEVRTESRFQSAFSIPLRFSVEGDFGAKPESPPESGAPEPETPEQSAGLEAVILIAPENPIPGQTVSVTAILTATDGSEVTDAERVWDCGPCQGPDDPEFTWDGEETPVDLTVTYQGKAYHFTESIPAYADGADAPGTDGDEGGKVLGVAAIIAAVIAALGAGLIGLAGVLIARLLRPPARTPPASPTGPPTRDPAKPIAEAENPVVPPWFQDWVGDQSLDPRVREFLTTPNALGGWMTVTPDRTQICSPLFPGFSMPTDLVTGASADPNAALYSTPIPAAGHQEVAKDVATALTKDLPLDSSILTRQGWRNLPPVAKELTVRIVAATMAGRLGLPNPNIRFDPEFRHLGQMTSRTNTMTIKTSGPGWNSPMQVIDTIAHELRHKQQWTPSVPMETGSIRALATRNVRGYVDWDTDPLKCSGQFVERDSQAIGRQVGNEVSKQAYLRQLERLKDTWDSLKPDGPTRPPGPARITSKQFFEFMDSHPHHRKAMQAAIKAGKVIVKDAR